MVRPIKYRRVASVPQVTYFKPAGVPMRALEDVALTVEEAEAIRLKDLEGLEQQECAEHMRVSRPTFYRILKSARGKLADVLLNGKALRIEGGNFAVDGQTFRCIEDNHQWPVRFEQLVASERLTCPRCESRSVVAVYPGPPWGGPGRRRARGARGGGRRRASSTGGVRRVRSEASEDRDAREPDYCAETSDEPAVVTRTTPRSYGAHAPRSSQRHDGGV